VRVVFLTHNYPRHAGDVPGAFLHPLATALVGRGHDVRVVAPADRGQDGREALDGVPVRRVHYAAPHRENLAYEGQMQRAVRSPSGLLALGALIRALRDGARAEAAGGAGETVVHAHWWIPAGLALPRELPKLVTLHGTDGRLLEKRAALRWLGRRVLRRARLVTAVSDDLAATVARVTFRRDVMSRVQPMPIDSRERPWTTGGGGIIVVARFTRQKRVDLAIRTLAELDGPLTLVGDGPERPALERLVASLKLQARVRFTGLISGAEVARELARADVMLFPAANEGFGLAAIEALIAGVPVVVCRDGGGVVSAVQSHGGGVVTDPTPGALAGAVRVSRTPARRASARTAGEHWREELAPNVVAERFEGWYREALRA
jgi:glycosyltransferase involved in cell wall biosynthesis